MHETGDQPATFEVANSGQVPSISGGNQNLRPETGRTYTVGTVITPRWIPNLSASVEYWHYTIKNAINAVSAQYVLDSCYSGSSQQYCSDIVRSSNQQINYVSTLYDNLGGLKTSGIDFDLDYRFRINRENTLTLSNNLQQISLICSRTSRVDHGITMPGAVFPGVFSGGYAQWYPARDQLHHRVVAA